MDKIKGKSWAGNFYHQFDSICEDVDGIMSKDTVKYVGNQVQSVGASVKKFYSNVVQDILPFIGDDVKLKAQSSTNNQVSMKDDVNSVTAIRTESNFINEEQPSPEQGSTDNVLNSSTSLPIELDNGIPFTELPCSDPSEEAQSSTNNLPFIGDGVKLKAQSSTNNLPFIGDDVKLKAQSSTNNQVGMKDDVNSVTAIRTEANPVNEEQPSMEQGSTDNVINSSTSSPIELDNGIPFIELPCSNPSEEVQSSTNNLPFIGDGVKLKAQSSTKNQVGMKDDVNSVVAIRTKSNSVHEEQPSMEQGSTDNVINSSTSSPIELDNGIPFTELPCSDPSEEAQSSTNNLPFIGDGVKLRAQSSTNNQVGMKDDVNSLVAIRTKSNSVHEEQPSMEQSSTDNVINSSTSSPIELDNGIPFTELLFSDPSEEAQSSTNNLPFIGDDVELKAQSSTNNQVGMKDDVNSVAAIRTESSSSSHWDKHDVGGVIGNLNLETVDLCDSAEHNRTSVILNGNISLAACHKRRNFRYYKKLIQEALTSRKRLSKEYEQLAILYGDINKVSHELFEPSSLPDSPASLHAATLLLQEDSETEWELL